MKQHEIKSGEIMWNKIKWIELLDMKKMKWSDVCEIKCCNVCNEIKSNDVKWSEIKWNKFLVEWIIMYFVTN